MKKIVSILLVAAMLLTGLAGCGGGGSKSDAATLSPESTGIKLENGISVELGNYSATFTSEGETATYNFTFMYYEGQLVFMPEGKDFGTAFLLLPGPYEYDPSTATATCEAPSDALSFSTHVRFISEEGAVRFSSDNTVEDIKEGRTSTVYGEGIKTD